MFGVNSNGMGGASLTEALQMKAELDHQQPSHEQFTKVVRNSLNEEYVPSRLIDPGFSPGEELPSEEPPAIVSVDPALMYQQYRSMGYKQGRINGFFWGLGLGAIVVYVAYRFI